MLNGVQFSVSINLLPFDSSAAAFCAHPNSWPGEFLSGNHIWQASLKHLFPLIALCYILSMGLSTVNLASVIILVQLADVL